MPIYSMCLKSDKECGSCRYFLCPDSERVDSTLVIYSNLSATGSCINHSGKYYGRTDIGIHEETGMKCYTKGEDSTSQKVGKFIFKTAIKKFIFKL